MTRVGFIGLGNIGFPMAKRVLDAGHEVIVHDVRAEAAQPLIDAGATWSGTPAELATETSFVLLSLPGPPDVESVVGGDDGLFDARGGARVVVDLSTNSLELVRRLAARGLEYGIAYLDAPVSGAPTRAAEGTLSVMVGGDAQAFEQVEPVLCSFGSHIVHLGETGMGTMAKLVNNQIYLCSSAILLEGFVLAAKAGLDMTSLLTVLRTSAAGPYLGMADRMLSRKFSETFFSLGLAEKDLSLLLEAARTLSTPMPVTDAAHQIYVQAMVAGYGAENFFATMKTTEQAAHTQIPYTEIDHIT
jgi:3-hydroxyisobutyrate dehydrogenase-like beta-hydroxyacid dehydrogenase